MLCWRRMQRHWSTPRPDRTLPISQNHQSELPDVAADYVVADGGAGQGCLSVSVAPTAKANGRPCLRPTERDGDPGPER